MCRFWETFYFWIDSEIHFRLDFEQLLITDSVPSKCSIQTWIWVNNHCCVDFEQIHLLKIEQIYVLKIEQILISETILSKFWFQTWFRTNFKFRFEFEQIFRSNLILNFKFEFQTAISVLSIFSLQTQFWDNFHAKLWRFNFEQS